jgi:hypothetical protein
MLNATPPLIEILASLVEQHLAAAVGGGPERAATT